jgi:hypothetical protein
MNKDKNMGIPGNDNQFWTALFAGFALGIIVGTVATLLLKHHF